MDVAAEMTGPDGNTVPAGMFTVSPAQLTVPAGGTATATLTADTRLDAAAGTYAGTVVATSGDRTLRTPVSVHREAESYDVTFTFLDRAGNPTPNYGFQLLDHATPEQYTDHDESGTVVMRLPKGTYYFNATQMLDMFTPLADYTEPALVVDGPAEHTFDARAGVKLGFTTDRPEARVGTAEVGYAMTTEWGTIEGGWELPDFDDFQVVPSRTAAPGAFGFTTRAQLARPDGTGEGYGFHASPYLYNLQHTDDGRVPADAVHEVTNARLAKVISSHAVVTPGKIGVRDLFLSMPLPHTLTEFYTPGTEWTPRFHDAASTTEFPPNGILNNAAPRSYELGKPARERWNVGVFGPAFPARTPYKPYSSAARLGDEILFSGGMYSDQNSDTEGSTPMTSGNTQLLRDGEVIAEQASTGSLFAGPLPADEAEYTIRTSATMPGTLSTRLDGEWTFRSAHVAGTEPKSIPVLAVRFAPNLDDHNAAPAGKFRFPVYVQRNGAEQPGAVNTPVVEISYDDGQTWRGVRLIRHHGQWLAEVDHPRGAEFASLRWSVSDADGNTGKATIIHAYVLKK
jgi:hypothetical protein